MSDGSRPPGSARTLEIKPDLNATDPYLVLGLPRTASQVEIKRTYFTLIRQYPPETEADKFKIIRAAYEKIKDATRRTETDIFLPQAPSPWQPEPFALVLDKAFYPSDLAVILRHWGDLGRTDFREDFKEIDL
jgi:curved DNA-binding protein CbpA